MGDVVGYIEDGAPVGLSEFTSLIVGISKKWDHYSYRWVGVYNMGIPWI